MNFFKNLSISRFVISLYGLQVSRSLKTSKAIKSGLQCTTFFSQILCLQVSVLIIHVYLCRCIVNDSLVSSQT